jgi:Uma2 family endonuclease
MVSRRARSVVYGAMGALAKVPARMTVDEFLNWDSGDFVTYELIDVEPRAMAPTNRSHATLQSELGGLIGNHLRANGSPCDAVTAPGVIPHLFAEHNMRVPDLGVTRTPYGTEQAALPEPVLLVEILSPTNQPKTWTNVWTYTSIPACRRSWCCIPTGSQPNCRGGPRTAPGRSE